MAHNPVNHPLRPIYRVLGFVAGAYLVVFGIVGLIQTSGHDFTGKIGVRVVGQEANLLWSAISLILGATGLMQTVTGRTADTEADKFRGWATLGFGPYGLATSRTDADFLGFSISTV